ncbi:hypothetical protein IRY61_02590 [Candidatus Saccharibacteria bacterium]|nr:hypothetical protein [Candidatus Saccharibacteria bacterium]
MNDWEFWAFVVFMVLQAALFWSPRFSVVKAAVTFGLLAAATLAEMRAYFG